MKSVVFIEIDIKYCALRYGETNGAGTCPAVLGVDSADKCFNSPKTCPVRASFVEDVVTLRFGEDNGFLPNAIECIKSLVGIEMSPSQISLGENLGVRASVTAKFRDHRFGDAAIGFDKYFAERDYDPFQQGTFWGKFIARHPFLQGRALRVIRGVLPAAFTTEYPQGTALPSSVLVDQEIRHFVIESLEEIDTGAATLSIVAKDVLKLADDDKALWPVPSTGRLVADISSGATSLTLTPTGVGADEYPASGHIVVAGNEWMTFTRAGDVLTVTRGQKGTAAQSHSAGDRVQLAYSKSSITPAAYLDDLFRLGAGIPDNFIPRASWDAECGTYLNRVYSMDIAEPTPVRELASEIIQQAALAVYSDEQSQTIKLRVLRPIASDAPIFDDSNILANDNGSTTLKVTAQPDKRVSEVHTWFGQTNPTESASETKNYRASRSLIDGNAVEDWVTPAIKRIFSRLIPFLGAAAADRVNEIISSRFRDPPRKMTFRTFAKSATLPFLGMSCQVGGKSLQSATGAPIYLPAIITRLRRDHAYFDVEAEEARGGAEPEDLSVRTLIIDANTFNVNLLNYHNTFFPPPDVADTFDLQIFIESGVVVGSGSTQSYANPTLPIAFDTGLWPSGVTLRMTLDGRIQGAGGRGGGPNDLIGLPGGVALKVRHPLEIITTDGEIWGGGGGGGARRADNAFTWGGGGGAGSVPGSGASFNNIDGQSGTDVTGGQSAWAPEGGNGGDPGQAGERGFLTYSPVYIAGGAPGAAIDGVSLCTFSSGTGDRRGPMIN